MKQELLYKLAKVAESLESKGHSKEADELDSVLLKLSKAKAKANLSQKPRKKLKAKEKVIWQVKITMEMEL